MAIFTRLFAIKIVASNVLGFSLSAIIRLLELVSSSFRLAKSLGESEKNAISLPEINAEDNINMINRPKENITPLVNNAKFAWKQ